MPQLLPAAAAWAAAAWSSAVTATAVTLTNVGVMAAIGEGATIALAGKIVGTAATLALSAAATAIMRPSVPSTGTTLDFKPDPKAAVRGAMGYTAVGGNKAFQATWGYNRVAMSLGVALSLGPIDAITQFQADGAAVTFSGAQSEATGFYAADMWQTRTLGLPGDAALLPPTGLKYGNPGLTGWGVQNAAPQVAFAFWTMVLAKNPEDRDIFTNGVPDPRWIGRWMKVWNPRRDDTYPGGSGPQRRDDWRTWEWSENPYVHALAWYRGHFKLNLDGSIDRTKRIAGIGAPDAALDIPAFVEGMNVADANQWTISGEWASTDPKAQVAMAMLQAGGGQPINRGAQISVLVNMPRVSTYTYTKADLIGQAQIRPLTPRRDRKNTIIPRFKSEANNWEYVAAGEVTDAGYRAEDRGEPRSVEVEYVHVRNAKQAGQLAAYDLVTLREGLTVTLPSKVHLMHVHAGDCITVDEPELAMVGQKFVVMRTTTDYKSATVTLELRSETDAKHAFALGQVAKAPPSPTLSAVDPTYMPPPVALDWTIAPRPPAPNGTSQPVIVIEGKVETSDVATVIIEYGPAIDGPWSPAYSGPPSATGRYEATGLTPQSDYWISVRYVAKNGATSDRYIVGPIIAPDLSAGVVIDTTPPADVAGLNLSSTSTPDAAGNPYVRIIATWTANTDEDLNGYEVEITEGSVTVVDYVATNQHSREALTGRTYTFRVRAIDKAGNRSAWTAPQDIVGAGDTTPPGPPTTLEATASVGSIFLRWTNPGASDLAKVEVWENTTNNSDTATKIAVVVGQPSGAGSYSRSGLPSGVTRYYWLKAVDTSGNASGFSSGISATTASIQVTDFASNIAAPELMTTVQRLAATPTLGRIVFDTTDRKLYRGTGSVWDRSTDGADITADSITAGQIAAGAISTTELAAGAVTAGKIGAGQVTTTELAAGAVNADKIQAGSITGDRISTSTSLPGTITVGSTGVSIGTIQSQADDPAARVNANSTLITPGRIQIQGGTSLDNWRDGTDINGGSIKTNSIQARSLVLAMRNVQSINNTFRAYPDTNVVGWTGGGIVYQNDSGTTTGLSLSSGSASYSGTTLFIYWSAGSTFLSTTTSQSVANGPNNVIMATYNGGALLTVYNGRTLITPEGIVTPSLSAISADLGSITAGFLRSPTDSYVLNLAAGTERALFAGGVAYRGELIGLSSEGIYLWVGPSSIARADARKSNGWLGLSMNTTGGPRFFGTDAPAGGGGFHAQANFAARVGSRTSPGSVTTSSVTITTTGATGSVSYDWSQLSGDDTWGITSSSGPITAFNTSVSTPGEQKRASFACLVTDAGSGRSFTIIVGAVAIYNV